MIGDESLGEFHLELVNTTLVDDAEYQCQVAPGKDGDRRLLGVAYLTVTGTSRYVLCTTRFQPN